MLALTILFEILLRASERIKNLKSNPQVRTTSKRTQHNVELFLSSKMGHSLERDVKLFGRELKDDHHHHPTTPLLEGMWVF